MCKNEVADPGRGAERFSERLFGMGPGCVKGDADPCFEGSGLWAKYENRGQRTRLQWRLGRLRRGFGSGFSVAGVADPGRGAERFSERLFGMGPGCVKGDADPCFEGCGLWAKCENRGQRTRLQWRRAPLRTIF